MSTAPPIFVTGCARSGTTLMTRLLDGHPDVLVFPIEIKYFRHLDMPSHFDRSKLATCTTPRDAVRQVIDSAYMRPLYGAKEEVGGRERVLEVVSSKVDPAAFINALNETSGVIDHRTAIEHFFKALLIGLGKSSDDISSVRLVEKTPFQEEYVEELLAAFPEARFVHMVRNPYAVAVSWRNRAATEMPRARLPLIQRSSLELALGNQERMPERYRVYAYEALVDDAEGVMKSVADFLGLHFDPVLLKPMILGEAWGGNSSVGDTTFTGVSNERIDAWRSRVLPIEVYGINRVLGPLVSEFGYELLDEPSRRRVWLEGFRLFPAKPWLWRKSFRKLRYAIQVIEEESSRPRQDVYDHGRSVPPLNSGSSS